MNALARLKRADTQWVGEILLIDRAVAIAIDVVPGATGQRAISDRANRRIGSAVELDGSRLMILLDPIDGSTDGVALQAERSDNDAIVTITFEAKNRA